MADGKKVNVLMICLGNICRSPMAEAVLLDILQKRNLTDKVSVDSAAVIDYHVGRVGPEGRATQILEKHGIKGFKHKVRQITTADFSKFDYIFGMDEENMSDLSDASKRAGSKSTAKVQMLGDYDPKKERIIIDPYYVG